MQGRERVRTLSVRRPKVHTTNPQKGEKVEKVGVKKKEQIEKQKGIGSALKRHQSHIINK